MRRVIAVEHVSLDGVIQAPGGPDEDRSGGFTHGGWIGPYADSVVGGAVRRQMNGAFDLLLGRTTYEIWAAYWPHHDAVWPGANVATKYVASTTTTSGPWPPAVVLGGDVAAAVRDLKRQPGPDLHVYGSGVLLQTLLRHDLVDALWLKVYPLVLGPGKRLFGDGTVPTAFEVARSEISPKGVFVVDYERTAALDGGRV